MRLMKIIRGKFIISCWIKFIRYGEWGEQGIYKNGLSRVWGLVWLTLKLLCLIRAFLYVNKNL